MRKIAEFLKVSWPHFIALIAALGGVPGIAFLWDRIHPAPIASTPPIAAVPLPAKPPTPPKKPRRVIPWPEVSRWSGQGQQWGLNSGSWSC